MRVGLTLFGGLFMFAMMFGALSGNRSAQASEDLPTAAVDLQAPSAEEKTRTAIFAGGCFWCTEAVFEELQGVSDVTSGYVGDSKETAKYDIVCSGLTKHAEAIRITYDPSKIHFGDLLQIFFALHDPTTLNRQGADQGTQYRSAIFYESDEQKRVAEAYIKQLKEAKSFSQPIVTTLEPVGAGFFAAEEYHQNFVCRAPAHPYVRAVALEKLRKVRDKFPAAVKPEVK